MCARDKDDAIGRGSIAISPALITDGRFFLNSSMHAQDRDAVIERARKAGVSAMVITGSSLKSSSRAQELCSISQQDGLLYFTAGVHPHDAKSCDEQTLPSLRQLASHPRCCAIGECGLDFNRLVCLAASMLFTSVTRWRIISSPSKLISFSSVICAQLQQDFTLLLGDSVWCSQCLNCGAGTSVRQRCKNTGLQSRCAWRGAPVLAQLPALPACCLSETHTSALPLKRLTLI